MNIDSKSQPQRNCDLVMNGGITSGVVYPLAACELAATFRFKNIGGTSAGAIAAAATAAAEFGRGSVEGGFRLLRELPTFLGTRPPGLPNPNLFYLFQPQQGTKPVFNICIAALEHGWSAVPRVIFAAVTAFWFSFLLGLLPGIGFLVWAWGEAAGPFLACCVAIGLFIALGVGLLCVAGTCYLRVVNGIPDNLFGLCTGMEGSESGLGSALTPWLTGYLNRLAGRSTEGRPLTFGDLWGTNDPSAARNTNLEMMTTCLSHGRPYRIPFRDDEDVKENRQFFFRSEEFERLFPKHVVAWLKDHPRPSRDEREREREAAFLQAGYYPLPEPWDLPVVVAVRMSLSFPVLLSAVPLHAIDFSRKEERDRKLERCWFSDGGISSNFPVHFFDSPLPRWPTFAINLTEKHPDYPAGAYLPKNNSAGTEQWTRFDHDASEPEKPVRGARQLAGFIGAILGAMQNWSDNTMTRLPGFRDRIARVSLTSDEGGLNLNMPPERINALSDRGKTAGLEFVQRFASPEPHHGLGWPNHRWVRLRSMLTTLEETLLKLDRSCSAPLNDDLAYDVWVKTAENESLPSYPWRSSDSGGWQHQRQAAEQMLASLRGCAQALQVGPNKPPPLAAGSPRPRPELRVHPRI